MTAIFRAKHPDPACREKICLQDYETAYVEHQNYLFQRFRNHTPGLNLDQYSVFQNFEKFRNTLWGAASYASRIHFRVTPADRSQPQIFTLEEIAVDGEVFYADLKSLMELGRVEMVVPDYLCGGPGNSMQSGMSLLLDSSRKFSTGDFQALIRELDELRPLHGEGMGNAFWFRCMETEFPTSTSVTVSQIGPVTLNPARDISTKIAPTTENGIVSCPKGNSAHYDEELEELVCEDFGGDDAEPDHAKWGIPFLDSLQSRI